MTDLANAKLMFRTKRILLTTSFVGLFLIIFKPTISYSLSYLNICDIPSFLDATILEIVTVFSIFCALFSYVKKRSVDAFFVLSIILATIIAIACLVNPGNGDVSMLSQGLGFTTETAIESWIMDWFPILSTICLISASSRHFRHELIWGVFIACLIYLFINLWSLFEQLGAEEIDNLFFGHRNTTFRIALPALTCSFVISSDKKRSWLAIPLFVFALSILQIRIAYSATSFCAVVVMSALFVVTLWKKPRKILNGLTYGIGYVILFFSIVLIRVQNLFSPLISSLLHRDITFTGRTIIWDDAFQRVDSNIMLQGYGQDYYWHTVGINGHFQKHAHNEILNMLLLGGVLSLVCFIALFVLSIKKLFENRYSNIANAFAVGLSGFLIIAIAEVGLSPGLFFVLAGSYYLIPKNGAKPGQSKGDAENVYKDASSESMDPNDPDRQNDTSSPQALKLHKHGTLSKQGTITMVSSVRQQKPYVFSLLLRHSSLAVDSTNTGKPLVCSPRAFVQTMCPIIP